MIDYPPWLPAWRIESLSCAARFADPELAALRPELAGRAVMLVRWRLAPGHAEPLHRQLAEQHLSRWYAASVVDARAWAVLPLAPVLRIVETVPPLFLAFRRAVDRELGLRGARIDYSRGPQGGWTVRIGYPGPLSHLADLFREAAGLAGLEITALDRGGDGGWRLHGRPVAPEAMTRAEFREPDRRSGKAIPNRFPSEEVIHEHEHFAPPCWQGSACARFSAAAPAVAQQSANERVYRQEALAHARAVTTAWRRLESYILEGSAGTPDPDGASVSGWSGAVPPAGSGWLADWTLRGVRARYCEDTLLVYLAPERLKGVGRDHRAVQAAPHAYAGGGAKARRRCCTGWKQAGPRVLRAALQ